MWWCRPQGRLRNQGVSAVNVFGEHVKDHCTTYLGNVCSNPLQYGTRLGQMSYKDTQLLTSHGENGPHARLD
jgi:hypothetical protein